MKETRNNIEQSIKFLFDKHGDKKKQDDLKIQSNRLSEFKEIKELKHGE